MAGQAAQFALVFERIINDTLTALDGIPDDTLNRRLELPETNSLFNLASHLLGAGEFWTLALGAGQTVARDRAAEFSASGGAAELAGRAQRWRDGLRDLLAALPDAALDKTVTPPTAYRGTLPEGQMTARECLLHAIEHSALHLGQIQITRQLLGLSAVAYS
ncbi:MAG TPA: DinB family protein [Dehalococcoidia bacterium]|nr:DinB family protein [Dehalococcoidia bacterium]